MSGLTAAHRLQARHDVTLFERDTRLGGHAHTVDVTTADGRELALDTGFIVHNRRTYPELIRLFDELDVATQDSDMSFSVRCEGCGLEYAGARGLGGVFAQAGNLTRRRFVRMLSEIRRFHREARRLLLAGAPDTLTLGRFLREGRYSDYFAGHFMLPLTAAVWSCSPETARAYPARYLFAFLANHGMLQVKGSPTWRTVVGGSRTYVERLAAGLGDGVRTGVDVRVHRTDDGVRVDVEGEEHAFDRLVLATHPDQALALLDDPTPDEAAVLGRFRYTANPALLHTDAGLLPTAPRARSSWNYVLDACASTHPTVQVTYGLNRLLALDEPEQYAVTLHGEHRVRPATVLMRTTYAHPAYTVDTLAAQRELHRLDAVRHTYLCGAYHGWGFHEDGCRSGVRAAAAVDASAGR